MVDRWRRGAFVGFDEGHMEGTHNFMGRAVVAAVGFGITTVANKNAFHGTLVDLGVVPILNEHEGTAPNFPKVRDVRLAPGPHLLWGFPGSQRSRRREIGEVRCSEIELIPPIRRDVSCKPHSPSAIHQSPMNALHMTVVRRGVRRREAEGGPPTCQKGFERTREELPVVQLDFTQLLSHFGLASKHPFPETREHVSLGGNWHRPDL